MPSAPRKRLREYRGPGGLVAIPGEPAPNGRDGKSVVAHAWDDYSPLVKVLARVLFEAWRDESGEHRRFIGGTHQQWIDVRQDDRAIFAEMAERLLAFFPAWYGMADADKANLILEADPGKEVQWPPREKE